MSWYTAGEIVVWLLIAAVLGCRARLAAARDTAAAPARRAPAPQAGARRPDRAPA